MGNYKTIGKRGWQMGRLWTRSFVLLSVVSLFLFTGFYMLLPTMPVYIKALGGYDAHVGLATGLFTLVAVLFRPLSGGMVDQYGRIPFLLWGLVVFAVTMALYGWVNSVAALILLRMIQGMSWSFITTASAAAVADVIPPDRRGEGMGWFGMAMTLAMAVGPLIGVAAQEGYSFRGAFVIAAGLAVAALGAAVTVRVPFQRKAGKRRLEVFDPAAVPVSVAVAFLALAYGAVTTFLPLFAGTIDVNSGVFFFVYACALAVARPLAGTLSDRYGEAFVVIPATVLASVSLLVLSAATGVGGVLAAAALYGMGFGSAQPALQAAILRMVSRERIGVANASFFTAFDLGIAFGSTLLGWVSQRLGYRAVFIAAAGSLAICLLVFMTMVRPLLERRDKMAVEEA